MAFLVSYITPQDYGAVGNGTTDDTAAINSALAAANTAGGGIVYLGQYSYLISGPISIPPYCYLVGNQLISLNLFSTIPTGLARLIASASWAPSSTTGMVEIASKTPGGWSTNTQSCGLQNVVLDGSLNSNANLNGIWLNGPVYDVHLDDVFIWKAPHNGIHASGQTESGITPTYPYHQRYDRVSTVRGGATGFNLVNFTDSTYANCLAFNNTSYGWYLQNVGNSIFTACRSEWQTNTTTGVGFYLTGQVGEVVFSGCETDQNASYGAFISSATATSSTGGGITFSGCKFHGDGNGGTDSVGIQISSSTIPVTISGSQTQVVLNGASYWPTTGINITSSSNVSMTGCGFQGVTNSYVDGGGNTLLLRKGCFGITGNTGSQTSAVLSEVPQVNEPIPDDRSLVAWNFHPYIGNTASVYTLSTGVVNLARIDVRVPTTITNVLVNLVTAGGTLTSGQNFAGLYNSSGTLLSATADQTTNWGTSGEKTMALSSPQTVTPGIYYLALLTNGTTGISLYRTNNTTTGYVNLGTTSSTFFFGTSGTSQTTLPATITLSSATGSVNVWWAAFS